MPLPKKDKRGADWFSWSLHLILGLLVGFLVGFMIAFRMVRYHFLAIDTMHIALGGMSLIGGAMTSYMGDRAWFRRSLFDPAEPPQSWASRGASLVIGSVGAALVVLALLTHSDESAYWHMLRHTAPAAKPFLGLSAALLSFVIYYALRHGIAITGLKFVRRDEQPHLFWLFIIFAVLANAYELMRLFR